MVELGVSVNPHGPSGWSFTCFTCYVLRTSSAHLRMDVFAALITVIQGYFSVVYNYMYVRIADLSKDYCFTKRKFGLTMH